MTDAAASLYPDLPTGAPPAPAARSTAIPPTDGAYTGEQPGEQQQPSPAEAKPAAVADKPPERPDAASSSIYADHVETRDLVRFDEPAATGPAEYQLEVPAELRAEGAEADAAMGQLRAGLVAAGAGASLAKELFGDAVAAASKGTLDHDPARTEATLRGLWGNAYDSKIEQVKGLVRQAAEHYPEITEFLNSTNLGNSPTFIRKLAARAAKMPRR